MTLEKPKRVVHRQKMTVERPLPDDRLWNIAEVAYYLNLPVEEIYARVARRSLPGASKLGRNLRFDPVKIKKWALQNAVATIEELTQ